MGHCVGTVRRSVAIERCYETLPCKVEMEHCYGALRWKAVRISLVMARSADQRMPKTLPTEAR